METKIQRGRALVLVGPQGCGKTTLARKLAAAEGPFRQIEAHDLDRDFQNWMGALTNTLIVDGFPATERGLQRVKALVGSEHFEVNRKMQESALVPTPNFIFCTGDVDAAWPILDDRRFTVVRMGARL